MQDEFIIVELPKWKKHQEKDLKTMSFFRVQTDIFSDVKLFVVNSTANLLWFYIMTVCASFRTQQVPINIKQAAINCKSRTDKIKLAANSLERIQLLRIHTQGIKTPYTIQDYTVLQHTKLDSVANADTDSNESGQDPKKPVNKKSNYEGTTSSRMIAEYCDLWTERYKADKSPRLTKKETGILSRIAKSMGDKESIEFLNAYFAMPDSWVVKAAHPVGLLETKKMEIYRFLKSGKFVTTAQVRQNDKALQNLSLLDKYNQEDSN